MVVLLRSSPNLSRATARRNLDQIFFPIIYIIIIIPSVNLISNQSKRHHDQFSITIVPKTAKVE